MIGLTHDRHSALICGKTKSGKTQFVLDELPHPETGYYRGVFKHVFVLCPNWEYNMTYHSRPWMWEGPGADRFVFHKCEGRLHQTLSKLFDMCAGTPTLYLIDDFGGTKELSQKKGTLSSLAMNGLHAKQSVWVLVQQYNTVVKEFRLQTERVILFHCKDRHSFGDALDENDIVPHSERDRIRSILASTKHSKLLLNTEQPSFYKVLLP
jgi:hypothetical protein